MGTVALRIVGGFVLVRPAELMAAWRACVDGPPGIGGFRAWLAIREMVARRRGAGAERRPSYGTAELARLLGVAERTARASLRRLIDAGLVEWSDAGIAFPECPAAYQLLDSIGSGRGVVPLPRRLVRFLAKGARPALVAVALGAVLRCVSRRRSGFGSRGRFKSSWVTEVFGVAERHARSARAELVQLGWLEPALDDAAGQWAWNRWGRAFLVRLDWQSPRIDRPTFSADPGASSSYPDSNPAPLRENLNPEPGVARPPGAPLGQGGGRPPVVVLGKVMAAGNKIPAPTLRNIRPADLADTARVLALHRQAVASGKVAPGEAGRLRFVAAVEHARSAGRANPPGLLARIVGRRWWHLLTQGDEDRARRRLCEHERPATPPTSVRPGSPRTATPSPLRSPYGAERPVREVSSLAALLSRLAGVRTSMGCRNDPEIRTNLPVVAEILDRNLPRFRVERKG